MKSTRDVTSILFMFGFVCSSYNAELYSWTLFRFELRKPDAVHAKNVRHDTMNLSSRLKYAHLQPEKQKILRCCSFN